MYHQLSPAEYEAYTLYLTDILRSGSPSTLAPGGTEDKVDKHVVRVYMVNELKISGELFDQVRPILRAYGMRTQSDIELERQLATRVASFPASRLSIGEIFALLRLAAHADASGSSDGRQLSDDLVFVQIAPIQAAQSPATGKIAYEPRRRVSVRSKPDSAAAPLPERKGKLSSVTGAPAGLNTRRLPPDVAGPAPPSPATAAPPASAPASSASASTNPFSAAMGAASDVDAARATSSARPPPPLPPKPTRSNAITQDDTLAARDPNPFRQRLQSNGGTAERAAAVTEMRKSSLVSPPLPPRPVDSIAPPSVKKTTFTPSTKSASSTASSSVVQSNHPSGPFRGHVSSGSFSYTPTMIKDALAAAEKAKQRGGSGSGPPTIATSVEVIRRSADTRLSLPAQSTGGSSVSTDGETSRRRGGSLLGYRPSKSGQSYNNLNPFEPLSPSNSLANATPPQLYVPKAPPAPLPRTKEVVKSAMPLPPPRRKVPTEPPSADRLLGSTGRQRNGSVASRRITLGHSDTKRLFDEAAAAHPANSSSDDDDNPSGGSRIDKDRLHRSGSGAAPQYSQRRASAPLAPHPARVLPGPPSSTTSSNSVAALRDNLEKMASDVRGEIAWLKGGRGGRWGAIGNHVGSDGEDIGRSEKERLVGGTGSA